MKRHRSKDCASIEKDKDGENDQGGGKGTKEDTERSSELERKRISCGEVSGWRGGDFNDDNPLKVLRSVPHVLNCCPLNDSLVSF